ncbi:MAG: ABC transporter ATP-binding protein [Bdellovibrionales bacterium]|nr:ABC transporter ATP-binding protein [Bdellovibrionales bacterium]
MSDVLLKGQNLAKLYKQGHENLEILKAVSIEIREGEAIAITGKSGAGKSTLLHILGTLDRPSQGELFFYDKAIHLMSDEEVSRFRNQTMGFVFQFHHLLPEFNALENVMLPAMIGGMPKKIARVTAMQVLKDVGLEHRLQHFPSELSGGERQRVAIARALIRKPKVVFADEPTGNLDTENGLKVQSLLFELHNKYNVALVVVTHDESFAAKFMRRYRMIDGHWQ